MWRAGSTRRSVVVINNNATPACGRAPSSTTTKLEAGLVSNESNVRRSATHCNAQHLLSRTRREQTSENAAVRLGLSQ